MTSTYASHNAGNRHEAPVDPTRKKNKRKVIIAAAAAGALALPTAAWAAVTLFGFGSFNSAATTTQNLTIENTPTVTEALAPGKSVGVKGQMKNPNDFTVKVTGIIVKAGSASVTPNEPANCDIHLHTRGTSETFPANGPGNPAVPNSTYFSIAPVELAPNEVKEIVVPNVLTQDPSATKLCGVSADYAVRGIVGNE